MNAKIKQKRKYINEHGNLVDPNRICEDCGGTGFVHSHNPHCWGCYGTGLHTVQIQRRQRLREEA
jgi:DnaJ-class molecular chaperone